MNKAEAKEYEKLMKEYDKLNERSEGEKDPRRKLEIIENAIEYAVKANELLLHKFRVNGAGEIILRERESLCGDEYGCSIGVTWGQHGVIGGVIPITELKRLSEFIKTFIKDFDENNNSISSLQQ